MLQRKQHYYYVEYSQLQSKTDEALGRLQQRFKLIHSKSLQDSESHCFAQSILTPEQIDLAALQSSGCGWHTQDTNFSYQLKHLATDLCSQLLNEHLSGVDFYQLTLFAGTHHGSARYQVQTTFALLHWPHAPCALKQIHLVSTGALSLRPLTP